MGSGRQPIVAKRPNSNRKLQSIENNKSTKHDKFQIKDNTIENDSKQIVQSTSQINEQLKSHKMDLSLKKSTKKRISQSAVKERESKQENLSSSLV